MTGRQYDGVYDGYEFFPTHEREDARARREDRNRVRNEAFNRMMADENIRKAAGTGGRGGTGSAKIGMKELAKIVLDLQQDIKRVTKGNCIVDARQYASKLGPHHQAVQGDWNKDGVEDIVIFDGNGNPVVVNGWSTTPSKWVERNKYYETRNPKESRSDWRRRILDPQYDNPEDPTELTGYNPPEWVTKTLAANKKNNTHWKVPQPKNRSLYRVFQEEILKRIWNDLPRGRVDSKAYLTACAFVWNTWVLPINLLLAFGGRGLDLHINLMCDGGFDDPVDTEMYNQMKKHNDTKSNIVSTVKTLYELYMTNSGDPIFDSIAEALIMGNALYLSKDRATAYNVRYIDHVIGILNDKFGLGIDLPGGGHPSDAPPGAPPGGPPGGGSAHWGDSQWGTYQDGFKKPGSVARTVSDWQTAHGSFPLGTTGLVEPSLLQLDELTGDFPSGSPVGTPRRVITSRLSSILQSKSGGQSGQLHSEKAITTWLDRLGAASLQRILDAMEVGGAVADYTKHDIQEGILNAIQPYYTGRLQIDAVVNWITSNI